MTFFSLAKIYNCVSEKVSDNMPIGTSVAFFYATAQVSIFMTYNPTIVSYPLWVVAVTLAYITYCLAAFSFSPINFGSIHKKIMRFGPKSEGSRKASSLARHRYAFVKKAVMPTTIDGCHPSFHSLNPRVCTSCITMKGFDVERIAVIHKSCENVVSRVLPDWNDDSIPNVESDSDRKDIIRSFDSASYDIDLIKSKYSLGSRIRHCSECGDCRFCYTHHCSFVGTCITESTYPIYICYILLSFALMIPATLTIIVSLLKVVWVMTVDKNLSVFLPFLMLTVQFVVATLVTIYLGFLLSQHSVLLVQNIEFNDVIKYDAIGMSQVHHSSDFRREHGFWLGTYLNIRWRVWRGPILDRKNIMPSVLLTRKEGRRADVYMSLVFLKEIAYTAACFGIPLFWYISGEFQAHNNPEITAKTYNISDLGTWTQYAVPHAKRAFIKESTFLYAHPL